MARAEQSSLRFSRIESRRLTLMLLISLLLHLGVWSGYELGKKLHWWQRLEEFLQAHHVVKKSPPVAQLQPPPEVQPQIFVDVTQSDPEPPKKTDYYSDKNSHAANPAEDKNSNRPKLNGKQTVTPKTETTPRFSKLQPSSPPPQPQAKPAPPTKPTPPVKPEPELAEAAPASSPLNKGDLKLAKKTSDQKAEEQKKEQLEKKQQQQAQQQQPPPRPRTLKEALEQRHLPGQEMQQDGGARRRLQPSFDVKASPFGDYDRAFIEAVQVHWDQLLDSQGFVQDRTGRVTVHFKLKSDGTVEEVSIQDNSVGYLLGYVCQAAIEEAAPFGKWPDEMRQIVGANYREITFTFDYY